MAKKASSEKVKVEAPKVSVLTTFCTSYSPSHDNGWKPMKNAKNFVDYINPLSGIYLENRAVEVLEKPLSFYKKVELIRVRPDKLSDEIQYFFFVRIGEIVLPLKAWSEDIYRVNALTELSINDDTVFDYLKFFCYFIEGTFFLIESADSEFLSGYYSQMDRDRFLSGYNGIEIVSEEDDRFVVQSRVIHDGYLFDAVYEVFKDGTVTMTSDQAVERL